MKNNLTLEQAKKMVETDKKAREKAEEIRCQEENTKLIGQCYKFRNSYSSDSGWWLYAQIIDYKKETMIINEVQKTTLGIEIKRDQKLMWKRIGLEHEGWIPISHA